MLNIFHGRRDLTTIVLGRMTSTFGDGVALVALTLRLQEDGARPYRVGLLLAAGVIPQLVLAPMIGRLVDSHDSRRLLVAGGLTELAVTIPLIALHSVVPILVLVAVLGAVSSMTAATWSALLPHVVEPDHLAEAVSAQTSLNVLALVGAPAIGGVLAGAFGSGLPVAIDAVTFAVVTVAAGLVRARRVPGGAAGFVPADGSDRRENGEADRGGLAVLRADPILAPLLAGVTLVLLLVGMVDVVLVYLVRETLHGGGVWYGLAEASWMAGMVLGSLGAGRLRTERRQVRATVLGVALACAGVAGFAAAPVVAVLVPLSVLGGVGNGYAGTCVSTLLLARTPEHVRGRVSVTANAILGGAQGVSLLLGGVVATALSPRAIYAVAGLLGLGTAVVLAVRTAAHPPAPGQPSTGQRASSARTATASDGGGSARMAAATRRADSA